MKIEFLKDSDELKKFVESCSLIEEVNYCDDGRDDGYFFERIYRTPDYTKFYSVECWLGKGIRKKSGFVSYRKNFKVNEPYVVTFVEVKPVEVTTTIYEGVN